MKSIRVMFLVAGVGACLGAAGCSSDDGNGTSYGAGGGSNNGSGGDAGGGGGSSSDSGAGTMTYHADLIGASETPPVQTAATGTADFVLSADKKSLSYHIKHNVQNATVSHIHVGFAQEPGNIVFPLSPVSSDMSGTIALTNADDLANLDGARFYVNVHSSANPKGEIRGQLLHTGDTLFVASLTGAQETPPNASTATGNASVVLDAAKQNILFHVNSTLTPTASHIHTGLATQAGPITIDFMPTSPVFNGTKPITAAQVTDLVEGRMYVNVHTAAFAKGEIRGQLILPGETLYSAAMNGQNEATPVTTNATGNAQFILSADRKSLRYEELFTGLTATVAHIHQGAAGVNGPVKHPLTLIDSGAGAKGTLSWPDFTPDDVTALDTSPSIYYTNAHTAANPNGEIRGQIQKQ